PELRSSLERMPTPQGRIVILRALGLAGDHASIERALETDPSPLVRGEAVDLAITSGEPESWRRAFHAIESDPLARRGGAVALARARGPDAELALAAALADEKDEQALRAVANALAARAGPPPAALVDAALGQGPRAVVAVDALGKSLTAERELALRSV